MTFFNILKFDNSHIIGYNNQPSVKETHFKPEDLKVTKKCVRLLETVPDMENCDTNNALLKRTFNIWTVTMYFSFLKYTHFGFSKIFGEVDKKLVYNYLACIISKINMF